MLVSLTVLYTGTGTFYVRVTTLTPLHLPPRATQYSTCNPVSERASATHFQHVQPTFCSCNLLSARANHFLLVQITFWSCNPLPHVQPQIPARRHLNSVLHATPPEHKLQFSILHVPPKALILPRCTYNYFHTPCFTCRRRTGHP